MKDFGGKLAVITGGGTGMGRELARQLVAEGCDVAMCDVAAENMQETRQLCEQEAPQGIIISTHMCDVSEEDQVLAFRDAVVDTHQRDHINLLFNNAGIGGGGSLINDTREDWERTFGICWYGVYYNARAFLPLLLASEEGHMINTSSVNGFWACLGRDIPHTAYSAAKFAVKGFSEALFTDLRLNAPHVKVSVVMPGHIGTSIGINSGKVLGHSDPLDMTAEEVAAARERMAKMGMPAAELSDDQIREAIHQRGLDFRDNAPTSSAAAATVILDGVRNEQWRILIGDDARALDELVRDDPETAYDESFMERLMARTQWNLGGVGD
ncbi:MAG: SDR family NAD(P)-dependent oxidoreductase [Gammaproteobacteria bacterium]|nr:SDR family NAD(P)-dependent oxidoreductase [Gammaproteobacteria bacterium]